MQIGQAASAVSAGLKPRPGLTSLMEDVCAQVFASAQARGIDLAAFVHPGLSDQAVPETTASQLTQLLRLLVGDAVKATVGGGVLVEIEPQGPNALRLRVHDTGGGAHADGPPRPGLAHSRRLAAQLGGALTVSVRPGKGETATVLAPLVLQPAADAWPHAAVGIGVCVRLRGVATRRSLSRYLELAGVPGALQSCADGAVMTFAEPGELVMAARREGLVVCVAPPGDSAPEATRRSDNVDADLPTPLRRDAVRALLEKGLAAPALAPCPTHDEAPPDASLASLPAGGYAEEAAELLAWLGACADRGDGAACVLAARDLQAISGLEGAVDVARRGGDLAQAGLTGRLPDRVRLAELGAALVRTVARPAPVAERRSAPAGPAPTNGDDAELLRELKMALAEEQFSLAYQPQVQGGSDQVVGVETLVRWMHPRDGAISPARFIPLAERHGLIAEITSWVVDRALAETRYFHGLQVAFNASAIEFADPAFVERLHTLILRHGYDPRRLEVEITETAILQHEEEVRRNIDRLRALGLKVALDDFGAGHSSLGHLRRYPFDKLKIDREFVTDCSRDMQSATIVHAVVSIGRALGMQVVAEGVETEVQRDFLRVAGVHAMQGFLFGGAVSVDELTRMLSRRRMMASA